MNFGLFSYWYATFGWFPFICFTGWLVIICIMINCKKHDNKLATRLTSKTTEKVINDSTIKTRSNNEHTSQIIVANHLNYPSDVSLKKQKIISFVCLLISGLCLVIALCYRGYIDSQVASAIRSNKIVKVKKEKIAKYVYDEKTKSYLVMTTNGKSFDTNTPLANTVVIKHNKIAKNNKAHKSMTLYTREPQYKYRNYPLFGGNTPKHILSITNYKTGKSVN